MVALTAIDTVLGLRKITVFTRSHQVGSSHWPIRACQRRYKDAEKVGINCFEILISSPDGSKVQLSYRVVRLVFIVVNIDNFTLFIKHCKYKVLKVS